MFSENEKISGRQLYRSIVVTLAGPTLLVCPGVAGKYGGDGFFVYGVAGVLTVIYTWLMLLIRRLCEKKRFKMKSMNNGGYLMGKTILQTLLAIKLLLLAVGGLYLICDVVTGILLPETSILMVLAVLAVALIYWNQGSIESSGRAFEILFYWVLVPVIVVVGMAIPKVEPGNLMPQLTTETKDIVAAGVFLWFLFTPSEILVLCSEHYKKDKKTTLGVWRGVAVLFAGNLITYGTILGIYGITGINEGTPYPLLKVMQISGIPGDFLRRVDGFMSVFLVLSLFCGMVMLLDYLGISIWDICDRLFKKRESDTKKKTSWIIRHKKQIFSSVIVIFMVISVIIIRENIAIKQPASGISEVYGDKKLISSVELEERAFVMSVIIGEDTVTFEIASDAQGMWQEESNYVTMKCNTVEEAEKLYKDNGDKRLDFTHMKMIFVEEKIYEEPVSKENLKYMYEQEKFAENILVCRLEGDISRMAANAMENGEAFAVKMEQIMVNSGKSEDMELYRVYGD